MALTPEQTPRKFSTRAILALLVTVLFLGLFGCRSVTPGAGQEAVLIKQPIFFGHGGVDGIPVKTGRTYVAFTTDSVLVDMQPQQFQVHFDDLMSSDGVPVDFDAVIRLQILESVRLIRDFGQNWYRNNIEKEFANRVRQAVRKHGMNETAINTQAVDAIDREVSQAMEEYIRQANIPIRLVQITVGKANPPDSIKNQRVQTAAEQQRVLTEQQRKLAEDSRLEAERSRAQADNAYRQSMQLSPEQFLRLESIKMQQAVCGGGRNCTFVLSDRGVTPIIDAR